ncbi:tetratricopeptide repeat protein [Flavobacterium sp.]|uniref:tetratricopeptide repeat protein n=1 Tax=Flavobacterium sp. TaxID=239 RepID=UPI002FD9BA7B
MKSNAFKFSIVALLFSAATVFAQEKTQIQVLSAVVKDQKIQGAEVIFQKNGETSVTATTDAGGRISIPKVFNGIDDNNITLIIKKPGYSTLVTKGPVNNLTYALSPVMEQLDGLRIVLTWGADPHDIDSHISYPGNHICFYHKTGSMANLDVDDVDSYGPETITIDRKQPGQKYIYAVHDYSDRDVHSGTRLSQVSDARVFVYIGNTLIRSYNVPRNEVGNTWVVFMIDENGSFQDINKFYDSDEWQAVKAKLEILRGKNDLTEVATTSQTDVAESNEVNKRGEDAYHAKQLEQSVSLYQRAIELNANNGQAYSNLGLSFQKLNREAEAIWANRKAIDLANGPNTNTIKASSYYNIAKIYENKGQWQDALDNFKKALTLKENPAYTKGIERMKQKLGIQ